MRVSLIFLCFVLVIVRTAAQNTASIVTDRRSQICPNASSYADGTRVCFELLSCSLGEIKVESNDIDKAIDLYLWCFRQRSFVVNTPDIEHY